MLLLLFVFKLQFISRSDSLRTRAPLWSYFNNILVTVVSEEDFKDNKEKKWGNMWFLYWNIAHATHSPNFPVCLSVLTCSCCSAAVELERNRSRDSTSRIISCFCMCDCTRLSDRISSKSKKLSLILRRAIQFSITFTMKGCVYTYKRVRLCICMFVCIKKEGRYKGKVSLGKIRFIT